MNEDPIRLVIAATTGILAISTASIFIKLCDAHLLVIASYRLGLASLFLAPIALRRRRYGKILRGRWKLLFPTGLFRALHFTFWIASLRYTSVASSVVIVNINPVFVGLGSCIILKEKVTTLMILGETVSLWKAAGGIPILGGIYVALRADITGVGLIISRGRE